MTDIDSLRQEFVSVCQRSFNLGLQKSTGGNISVRINQDSFLVKPSGRSLVDLGPEHLLICDADGRVITGEGRPTKEISSHLAIYQVRPEVVAVVHYHPPYATGFAAAGREIPLLTVHARRILGRMPLLAPAGEGSQELIDSLRQAFSETTVQAAILAQHGVIAAGGSLLHAQNLAELVEESAQIAFVHTVLQTTAPSSSDIGR